MAGRLPATHKQNIDGSLMKFFEIKCTKAVFISRFDTKTGPVHSTEIEFITCMFIKIMHNIFASGEKGVVAINSMNEDKFFVQQVDGLHNTWNFGFL
jgi:hypothetical protein